MRPAAASVMEDRKHAVQTRASTERAVTRQNGTEPVRSPASPHLAPSGRSLNEPSCPRIAAARLSTAPQKLVSNF